MTENIISAHERAAISSLARRGDVVAKVLLDVVDRFPRKAFTDSSLPVASSVPVGTMVWNSEDNAPNWSDGAAWVAAQGQPSAPTASLNGTLTTSNEQPVDVGDYIPADGAVTTIEANVSARRTGDLTKMGYGAELQGVFRRDGNSIVQIGPTRVVTQEREDAALSATFTTSGTSIKVRVTGKTGVQFTWRVTSEVTVA